MAYHPFYSSFSPPPSSTIPPPSPNPYGYGYSSHCNHEQQPPLSYSQPQPPPSYSSTPCYTPPSPCYSHGYTPPSPNQYTSSSNPYTPLASLYSQFQPPPPYSAHYNNTHPYSQPAGYQHSGAPYQAMFPLGVHPQLEPSLTAASFTTSVSSTTSHPLSVARPSPQPSKVSVSPFPLGVDDPGQITSPLSLACLVTSSLPATTTRQLPPPPDNVSLPPPPARKPPDPSFARGDPTVTLPPLKPPESDLFTGSNGMSPNERLPRLKGSATVDSPEAVEDAAEQNSTYTGSVTMTESSHEADSLADRVTNPMAETILNLVSAVAQPAFRQKRFPTMPPPPDQKPRDYHLHKSPPSPPNMLRDLTPLSFDEESFGALDKENNQPLIKETLREHQAAIYMPLSHSPLSQEAYSPMDPQKATFSINSATSRDTVCSPCSIPPGSVSFPCAQRSPSDPHDFCNVKSQPSETNTILVKCFQPTAVHHVSPHVLQNSSEEPFTPSKNPQHSGNQLSHNCLNSEFPILSPNFSCGFSQIPPINTQVAIHTPSITRSVHVATNVSMFPVVSHTNLWTKHLSCTFQRATPRAFNNYTIWPNNFPLFLEESTAQQGHIILIQGNYICIDPSHVQAMRSRVTVIGTSYENWEIGKKPCNLEAKVDLHGVNNTDVIHVVDNWLTKMLHNEGIIGDIKAVERQYVNKWSINGSINEPHSPFSNSHAVIGFHTPPQLQPSPSILQIHGPQLFQLDKISKLPNNAPVAPLTVPYNRQTFPPNSIKQSKGNGKWQPWDPGGLLDMNIAAKPTSGT